MKRLLLLAPVLLLVLLGTAPVAAETDIVVIASDVQPSFPLEAVFTLEVESYAEIVDVRLRYRVDKMNYAEVVSEGWADFTPTNRTTANWRWDMRRGSLPPGAEVTYWWMIEDADGNRLETSPQVMHFDDNRFAWQSLTSLTDDGSELRLFWYQGSDSFAQELLAACEQGLARLTEGIGAHPERPIEIYVYASAGDLQGGMIFPQEWTGGVAFTEFSTIAIGIAPTRVDWGKRALVHELTHLVVHQVTFSPYGQLPTWLDEGLAMYNEGELESHFQSRLRTAIQDGSLISVRSLCSPFSAESDKAYLSYAQSYSLVEYLLDAHGPELMLELLTVFKQGSTYDAALIEVYGFDIEGLDARWSATLATSSLADGSVPAGALQGRVWRSQPVLIVLVAVLVLWIILTLAKRGRASGQAAEEGEL